MSQTRVRLTGSGHAFGVTLDGTVVGFVATRDGVRWTAKDAYGDPIVTARSKHGAMNEVLKHHAALRLLAAVDA